MFESEAKSQDKARTCFSLAQAQWSPVKHTANPMHDLGTGGTAQDDTVESYVQFSLDTPLSVLPKFVDEATKRLFSAFDGATIPLRTTEIAVRRLFERKL